MPTFPARKESTPRASGWKWSGRRVDCPSSILHFPLPIGQDIERRRWRIGPKKKSGRSLEPDAAHDEAGEEADHEHHRAPDGRGIDERLPPIDGPEDDARDDGGIAHDGRRGRA